MSRAKSGATQRTPAAESKRSSTSAHSVQQHASPAAATLAAPHCACGGGCPRCRRPPASLHGVALGDPHSALEHDADRIARQLVKSASAKPATKSLKPAAARPANAAKAAKATVKAKPKAASPPPKTAGRAKPKVIIKPKLTPEEKADELETGPVVNGPQFGERVEPKRPPLRKLSTPRRLSGGYMLPPALRSAFEAQLGVDLSAIRLHADAGAAATAAGVGARAFALGTDIVFGAGAYDPSSTTGLELIAHEVAHVLQQSARPVSAGALPRWLTPTLGAQSGLLIQRQLSMPPRRASPDDPPPPPGQVPDDAEVDRAIEWPLAGQKNEGWWTSMHISDLHIMRDLDPAHQPRAWANHVLHAQQIMRAHGIQAIEGARVSEDGILGPRTFLALRQIAQNPTAPGRPEIQGLGFNLDAIRDASDAALRARAFARLPEIVVQTPITVLGEDAVRYYDLMFSRLTTGDRDNFDTLLFGGPAPAGIRRADRIELLRQFYGRDARHLTGTVSLVRLRRDFVAPDIDVLHTARQDNVGLGQVYFQFSASSVLRVRTLQQSFSALTTIDAAGRRLTGTHLQDYADTLAMLAAQDSGIAPNATESAAVLVAIYLPAIEESRRLAVVAAYQAEKARREQEETQRIETHNRGVATQRADDLQRLIEATDMFHPTRMVQFQHALEMNLRDGDFFDLVLDDLRARPNDMFGRLFTIITDDMGDGALGTLVELSLHGRYRDDPTVQRALHTLIDRHHANRAHGYDTTGRGAILLDGSNRVEVGEVCGDISVMYKRVESREQMKPESRRRLEATLENEARAYMTSLIAGTEAAHTQEDVGQMLLQRAWTNAGLTEDDDIEDVHWEESLKILGVRAAAPSADGVPRYDVNYQVVQRIRGGTGGDTPWVPVGDASTTSSALTPGATPTQGGITGSPAATSAGPALGDWHSEGDFEYALFWYEYSQQARVMIAFAKIVTIGAVIIVAWEVGAIAALVAAGGGALPVALSIGISMAIYMLTHHRWTLEGLLLAGFEGYLAAVGFKVFAPVGAMVGRFIIPAALEEVTFTRAVAAWLLRRAAVGGLTGGTLGPASLLVHDLVRMARVGGGFSPFMAYLQSAGMGALLGAVFEIGGSLVLAPVFEAANQTVLRQLSEVITALRSREPPISTSQWFAEIAGSLSRFRGFLGTMVDDAIARGIQEAVAERLAQVSTAYMNGLRNSIQREILSLAEIELTHEATDGLERLLRLGRTTMNDDAMATLLQAARRNTANADAWLSFLNGAEDSGLTTMLGRNQVRGLLESPGVLAFGARRGAGEMMHLMSSRFNNSLADLETYSQRVLNLDEGVRDQVFNALRDRGTAVTARSVLRIAEAGAALDDEMLGGLQRLLDGADATRVDAVLDAMTHEQVSPFLQRTHTANAADLTATREMVATYQPREVAWAAELAPTNAETLLRTLTPAARTAIADITATEAEALVADLGLARVNRALGAGAPNGLTGQHLLALRTRLHVSSAIDMLEWAAADVTRLGKVQGFSSFLNAADAAVPVGGALRGNSLVVDTNTMIAVERLLLGRPFATLEPNLQEAINAVRAANGVTAPYADLAGGARPSVDHVVGARVDLRTTTAAAAELLRGEAATATSSGALGSFERVNAARAHADYADVVADLNTGLPVGRPKGAIDRSFVADALFAEVPAGVRPRIVSVDEDVVTRLARRFVTGPRPWGITRSLSEWDYLIARYPEGQFSIAIRGHPMDVVFGPPTGVPAVTH